MRTVRFGTKEMHKKMHIFDLPIRNTLKMRLSKNWRTFEQLAPFVQLMPFEQLAIPYPLNLHVRKISEPSNNWRPSKNWRPSYN